MSEPVHIRDILPDVMRNIKDRCNEHRRKYGLPLVGEPELTGESHQSRVVSAVKDFLQRKTKHPVKPKKQRARRTMNFLE